MAEKEEILSKRIENQTEALRLANEKVLTQKGQLKALNSKIKKQQSELEKKDKIIDLIKEGVRNHISFENRLKRDKREPDLFNQGRFYVANNINNILRGK